MVKIAGPKEDNRTPKMSWVWSVLTPRQNIVVYPRKLVYEFTRIHDDILSQCQDSIHVRGVYEECSGSGTAYTA